MPQPGIPPPLLVAIVVIVVAMLLRKIFEDGIVPVISYLAIVIAAIFIGVAYGGWILWTIMFGGLELVLTNCGLGIFVLVAAFVILLGIGKR